MKNNIQLLVITFGFSFCCQFNTTLYAQKNAVKINLINVGSVSLEYERAYDTKNTILFGFQKWDHTNLHTSTISFLGITSKNVKQTDLKGYRLECLARHYAKKTYKGGFFESGLYFGRLDIKIKETSTTYNLISFFLWDFEDISETSTKNSAYKDVFIAGGKIGGGFQKALGPVAVEISGGLNINAINSRNVRPILALKGVSPYVRMALGVAF